MELKEQVCSLESAKRLKELGVKQESFFYWYRWTDTFNRQFGELPDEKDNNTLGAPSIQPVPLSGITDRFSAFTVAELGEMLPYKVGENDFCEPQLHCGKGNSYWDIRYYRHQNYSQPIAFQQGDTEAEVRAKMLIYLLENKLI